MNTTFEHPVRQPVASKTSGAPARKALKRLLLAGLSPIALMAVMPAFAQTVNIAETVTQSVADNATLTVTETGSIITTDPAGVMDGVDGSTITVDNAGTIEGVTGIDALGSTLAVTNTGTITGVTGRAIQADSISNLENSGTIVGGSGFFAVVSDNGPATVANSATGEISGTAAGVKVSNGALSLTNEGRITATTGDAVNMEDGVVRNASGATLSGATGILGRGLPSGDTAIFNAGTIEGTGGTAIKLNDGNNNNILQLETGSDLIGNVTGSTGSGTDTLILIGTGTEDATFSNFENLFVGADAGATWTLKNDNYFTDTIEVDSGELVLDGMVQTDGGATVNAGGTLGGEGTVIGRVTLVDGGAISGGREGDSFLALNVTDGINVINGGSVTGRAQSSGGVNVRSGEFVLDGTLTSPGLTIESGATLSGAGELEAPLILEDASLSGGTITGTDSENRSVYNGNLLLKQGVRVVNGATQSGNVTVYGAIRVDSGTLSIAGFLDAQNAILLDDGLTLEVVEGGYLLGRGGIQSGASNATLTLDNNGVVSLGDGIDVETLNLVNHEGGVIVGGGGNEPIIDVTTLESLINMGVISASDGHAIKANRIDALNNSGTIKSEDDNAIDVFNDATLTNTGTIESDDDHAIEIVVGTLDLENSGTVQSFGDHAIEAFYNIGTLTNTGTISTPKGTAIFAGDRNGSSTQGVISDLANSGTISGGSGFDDSAIKFSGGSITNSAGGVIEGFEGIESYGPFHVASPSTRITNAGTIRATGEGGLAIEYFNNVTNTLELQTGSVLEGDVHSEDGFRSQSATDDLILTGMGSEDAVFTNFENLTVNADDGQTWTLTGDNAFAHRATVNSGTFEVGGTFETGFTSFVSDGASVEIAEGASLSSASGSAIFGSGITVTNAGTISGTDLAVFSLGSSFGAVAVDLFGNRDNTLNLLKGSVLEGDVLGGSGTDTLMLFAEGREDARFSNFEYLGVAAESGKTWTLSGDNTFTEGVAVASGTLAVDATLTAANGVDVATSTMILGAGPAALAGTGTVVGDVNLDNAAIRVTAVEGDVTVTNGAAQSGTTNVTGTTTVNSGTFAVGGALSTDHSVAVSDGATVTVASGAALNSTGGAAITAANAPVFNLANVEANIPFGDNVEFSTAGATTVINAGTISGMGGIAVDFSGAGDNALTLQTGSVLDGDVVGGTGTDSLTLEGLGNEDAAFSNFETLTVDADAGETWTLSGDSDFSQTATVNSGTLVVDGMVSAAGGLTVGRDARLAGSGTVVADTTVAEGATLAAGNGSTEALAVTGDLTLQSGSVLEANLDAAGLANAVNVTGEVTVDSARLHIASITGEHADGQAFTLIENDGSDAVSGSGFASITDEMLFLDASVATDGGSGNDVVLTLGRNDTAVTDVADTANQMAVAGAIEGGFTAAATTGTDGETILLEILTQTSEEAVQDIYGSISGEGHASNLGTFASRGNILQSTLEDHVRSARGTLDAVEKQNVLSFLEGSSLHNTRVSSFWIEGYGTKYDVDADGNAEGLSGNFNGTTLGLDFPIDASQGSLMGGVALGIGQSKTNVGAYGTNLEADSVDAMGYLSWTNHTGFYVDVTAGVSHHDIQGSRAIQVGSIARTAQSDYSGMQAHVSGQVGQVFQIGQAQIEPFVGVNKQYAEIDGFTETGAGSLNLTADKSSYSALHGKIGVNASTRFTWQEVAWAAHARAVWEHAFEDTTSDLGLSFAGGGAYTVQGADRSRDAVLLGAGVDVTLPSGALGYFNYGARLSSGETSHNLSLGVRMDF